MMSLKKYFGFKSQIPFNKSMTDEPKTSVDSEDDDDEVVVVVDPPTSVVDSNTRVQRANEEIQATRALLATRHKRKNPEQDREQDQKQDQDQKTQELPQDPGVLCCVLCCVVGWET